MPRLFLGFVFVLSAAGLTPIAAIANTSSHNFGPHTKAEIVALCAHVHGAMTESTGKWDCKAARWEIACINSGKSCTIDLLGTVTGVTGPSAGGGSTPPASMPPQHGNGLSGNGGAGNVGGKVGGGTSGSLG